MFLSNKKYQELMARIDTIDNKVGDIAHGRAALQTTHENESLSCSNDFFKKQVAYALNLCTVSVSQIIDYNDIYILEQEYDAILNNLNLQNFIKDEPLLNVLKQILDTITFFKIQDGDKKFIEKEYQLKMKNAIWSAVPNFSVILAGGSPWQMAFSAVMQIGSGYMNYRKNKNQYSIDREKQEWELQRSAMEQFNGLRRELFEVAWRLSDMYDFDDALRLTEKQISHYNSILIDTDPLRRFEKLDSISDTFEAFPPFWFFKGNAAREILHEEAYAEMHEAFKNKAIEAFRKFDEIYVYFMREDIIAASCALEHISLLNIENDRNEIEKLLLRATKLAGDNFDVLQMCVLVYVSLNNLSEAKKTLRRLVNEKYNLGLNGLLLSRIYCKIDKNKEEYEILKNRVGESYVMPWIENDEESDKKYIELRGKDVHWRFNAFSHELAAKHQLTFEDRLAYGSLPDRIDWFVDKDENIPYLIVESLNRLFLEFVQIPFLKGINLKDIHNSVEQKIRSYCRQEKITRYSIKNDFTRIHRNRKNHDDNVKMVNMIKALIVDKIHDIYLSFSVSLIKEFNNYFTINRAESADTIIDGINAWYTNNKIEIPPIPEDHTQPNLCSTLSQESKIFFDYADYESENEI